MSVATRRELDLSTYRPLDIKLFAVALALILTLVGYMFDLVVLRGSHSVGHALFFSNLLTGGLAGLLLHRLLADTRRKQIAFIFRMATLADLNQLAAQASVAAEELDVKEDGKRRLADLEHTLARLRQTVAELVPLADY
jgi:hypothetical protein